jgi:hypothetical protein
MKYELSDTLKIPYTISISGQYIPSKDDNISVNISTDSEELNLFLENGEITIEESITKGHLLFHSGKNSFAKLKDIVKAIYEKNGFVNLVIQPLKKQSFTVNEKSISISLDNKTKWIALRKIEADTSKAKVDSDGKETDPDKKETDSETEETDSGTKYNFYLGANFDLKETLQANSFYSEIDVFLPGQFFTNKKGVTWGGIRAGIYKNNLTTSLKEFTGNRVVYELKVDSSHVDSVTLEQKLVRGTPKTSFSNLGFYAELLMLIHKSKNGQFQAFVAPHAEIIQRVETTTFESDEIIGIQRTTIARDSILNDHRLRALVSSNGERTNKYFNSYFGIGLPTKYISKEIEVFLNPVMGFGDATLSGNRNEQGNFFGLFQFHLMERKHGIKLSGEVRKYFNAGQDPLMVINLSKRFNLDALIDSDKEKPE